MNMAALNTAIVLLLVMQGRDATTTSSLTMNDVITAASTNVKEFQDVIPDFVCNERITSTRLESGKVKSEKVVDSIFSINRKSGTHREITSIDGRPAKNGAGMPSLPVRITLPFTVVRDLTLSPGNLDAHEFALDTGMPAKGPVLIRFSTKKDQKKLVWDLDGDDKVARDEGKVLIDLGSMQVIRMERRLLNLPKSLSRFDLLADFGPFTIGEQQFWLPKMIRTEIAERDPKKTGTHVAEYSNCRKFGVDTRILP